MSIQYQSSSVQHHFNAAILVTILLSWIQYHITNRKFLSFSALLKKQRERAERGFDLCDAGAVLHQMSYRANWELVVIRYGSMVSP